VDSTGEAGGANGQKRTLNNCTSYRQIPFQEPMSNRRIVNVPKTSQRDLAGQFHWLMDVDLNEQRADVQILSVSVFDR